MNILFHDDTPAYLCHGGKQVLTQKLHDELRGLGVNVEFARWWDSTQACDLLHLFSPTASMISMAQQAGVKVVLTHIVDRLANLSPSARGMRRAAGYVLRTFLPEGALRRVSWSMLSHIDAAVYLHQFDAEAAISVYGVPRNRTRIIPHGYDADHLTRLALGARNRGSYLVSVASVVPRKNTVLLARAAHRAKVPVVFIGKPFNQEDRYYQEFRSLVDGSSVIYKGYVAEEEKIRALTGASGFVLLSSAESGCIAIYEAAAAGLPLLLNNAPWARSYGEHASIEYVGLEREEVVAERLKSFYTRSTRLETTTFPIISWKKVAQQYRDLYQAVLAGHALVGVAQ